VNKKLIESGLMLYLKEHTRETRNLRIILTAGLVIFLAIILFAFWYARKYHVIAYLAGAGL